MIKMVSLTEAECAVIVELCDAAEKGFQVQKIMNPTPPPNEIVQFYTDLATLRAKVASAKPIMDLVRV